MNTCKIVILSLTLFFSIKAQPKSFQFSDSMHLVSCNNGVESDGLPMLVISKEGVIFAATYRKLYRSTDDGKSWTNIGKSLNLPGPNQYKKILPFDSTIIFLATANHGVYKSTNNGLTWSLSNRNPSAVIVHAIAKDLRGRIFMSTGANPFISSDTGRTWEFAGYPDSGTNEYVVNSDGFMLCSEVTDGEKALYDTYVCNTENDSANQVILKGTGRLRIIPSRGKELFLAGENDKLYFSNDNGNSWNISNLSSFGILNIIETPDSRLFAADENNGIYCSTDPGKSWTKIEIDIPRSDIMSMALHPNGYLYFGTRKGIFRSSLKIDKLR